MTCRSLADFLLPAGSRSRAASSRPSRAAFTVAGLAVTAIALGMITAASSPSEAAPAAAPPLPTPKPKGVARLQTAELSTKLPARDLFKQARSAAPFDPAPIGGYSRGCLAGAEQLPKDGPTWQAMRLSRNRHWGHPEMIKLVKRLAEESHRIDGWPGLLVGDIAMPRGGPMWPSHSSHQIGLDADIWLTPMPDRRFTFKERESTSATYMLTSDQLAINPEVWTEGREKLIKRAAKYPEVERVLVHPAIKKRLCETAGSDRDWLSKVRPVWGHNYHFHIRMSCPPGSTGCQRQTPPPTNVDSCGKELDEWYVRLEARLKPRPKVTGPRKPAKKRRLLTLDDLPNQCHMVLGAR